MFKDVYVYNNMPWPGRVWVSGANNEWNEVPPLSLYTLTSSAVCGTEEMATDMSGECTIATESPLEKSN